MKFLKIGGVVVLAAVLTALGIDASDTLSGSSDTLLGQLISSETKSLCPQGMVHVPSALTFTCVDIYEASADKNCPFPAPADERETKTNVDSQNCSAVSRNDVEPWRFITREQASLACMRAGKRLPESNEWYSFAAGTSEQKEACNIESESHQKTGQRESCVSALGVHDSIGNVWEWTLGDVIDGKYDGRDLPLDGYVTQVDSSGMATLVGDRASELFYDDYFWSSKNGVFGILRGGYYASRSDAGVYAAHARTSPTSFGTAIGFRCVQ
jgi:hypothetical protein